MIDNQPKSILETLLFRLDSPDEKLQLVTSEEANDWPMGLLDMLCREGLLAPTAPASLFACNQCDDPHSEEVTRLESPGDGTRFCIYCPAVGRVQVNPEELRQWILIPEGWAKLSGRLLGSDGKHQVNIPNRLWHIGIANLGGVNREVFFVRGLAWADGQSVEAGIRANRYTVPPVVIFPQRSSGIKLDSLLPLSQILCFTDAGFSFDQPTLDFIRAGWPEIDSTRGEVKTVDHFILSEDCRTAVLDGVLFVFTPRQAQVIELLHDAYQHGTSELSQEYIIDRIGSTSDNLALRDIFRNSKAWNILVIPGSRRGMYRLDI